MPDTVIRAATVEDSALILRFVNELATFERASDQVRASVDDIRESIFGTDSVAHALVCSIDAEPAGFAVYFFNYSTWLGKKGLYLEDLYVSPDSRGKGAGKALLKHLPSRKFYESFGAQPQSEWIGYRLSGAALSDLA